MASLPVQVESCSKCERCSIHNRAICRAVSTELLARLNAISYLKKYKRDETVIAQGEDAGFVGNIVSGILRLNKTAEDGRHQIVGLLYPSDFFGRVFEDHQHFAIEAATDVVLCCMDRHRFEELLLHSPEMEHALLTSTLDELDATRETMFLLASRTTIERVATFILLMLKRSPNRLCENGRAPEDLHVAIPISRRDMAALLGTSIETISRHIHMLARKRVIELVTPRHFVVLDLDKLRQFAGQEDEDANDIYLPQKTIRAG